ncbi:hypothetical protein PG637_06050 [Riemerella anatipestifer]|nr:hypothetical protein [Riemerella anatipestifer]MDY3325235.1 hypothetical protein [Riemerella anatipestifer]MDY3352775.1 hypothetical protein [Riemerella anatipestifer]
MKTTATKLSVLAFLGLGLAVYGQSGKVGVNISLPRATLDVQPNATNSQDNAKTNEGILAPQLSKTRVASIEAPVEGTLVYVIDDATKVKGTINDYTGSDPKVAKITEKGYYYYNGTEWVKSAAGSLDQEWVYNPTNKRIELKRSGTAPFNNKVYYDEKGSFFNGSLDEGASFVFTQTTNTPTIVTNHYSVPFNKTMMGKVSNYNNLNSLPAIDYTFPSGFQFKAKNHLVNVLEIDENDQLTSGEYISNFRNYINVKQGVTGTISQLYADINSLNMVSSGTVATSVGSYNGVGIGESQSVGSARASYDNVSFDSSGNASSLIATEGYIYIKPNTTGNITNARAGNFSINARGAGNVNSLTSVYGLTSVSENTAAASRAGEQIIGGQFETQNNGNIKFNNQIGIIIRNTVGANAETPINNYGLRIDDIQKGSTSNYAIYTGLGQVRFGDNVGIGVDAPTEKLEVDGKVKATAFMGASGATIFPDYVFQKYYTGTSSLKADYSFKTLSQVENFVKTNGHLPGYQSAAEIKKQGYVDLMATQLTNVEKIEELYLHLLEKDKEVKELKAKNEELETRLQKLETLLNQ